MMMRCLEAGGMDVAYDDSQERLNVRHDGSLYVPNPNGFYALSEDFRRPDLYDIYAGKAMKIPFRDLTSLPKGEYKILFIKRNPEEIRKSMDAFTPGRHWGQDSSILFFYDMVISSLLEQLSTRDDVEIIVMEYADIVTNPLGAFSRLKERGWDIDVERAISKVDSSLHRFKLEAK